MRLIGISFLQNFGYDFPFRGPAHQTRSRADRQARSVLIRQADWKALRLIWFLTNIINVCDN
jgi:hypothetical protein